MSLVSLALVAAACSSSSSDGTAVPPADAGGQPDAAAPVVDSGVDAAREAGPDGTKACDLLSATVLATQPQVLQVPSNSHPRAEAPTPAGGSVLDGTYRLTSVNSYFDSTGATPGGKTRATLQLKGGLWEHASTDYDGVTGMPSNQSTGGGAYVVNGTEAGPAPGPPGGPASPSCGSGQFFGGPSGGLSGIGFTATPASLTFIRPNLPGTVVIVSVYSKDP